MTRRAELDAVTVGQIRQRLEDNLKDDIATLDKLILQRDIDAAKRQLAGAIVERQEEMSGLDRLAGMTLLIPKLRNND
jgi:hypothetical protein